MTTVPVGSLTDAELAVLTAPRTRVGPRPVMPAWSRLPRDRRAGAVREARAGLVARRLVTPSSGGRAAVRRDLRSVLVLRRSATLVVALARATPHRSDHWYAHLVGDVVLREQVSLDGVHHFALAAVATLPDLVAAAALHPGAAAASAPSPGEATDWLRADLELRGDGQARLGWVSGPCGTWRAAGHPTAPAEVRRQLRELLGPGRPLRGGRP